MENQFVLIDRAVSAGALKNFKIPNISQNFTLNFEKYKLKFKYVVIRTKGSFAVETRDINNRNDLTFTAKIQDSVNNYIDLEYTTAGINDFKEILIFEIGTIERLTRKNISLLFSQTNNITEIEIFGTNDPLNSNLYLENGFGQLITKYIPIDNDGYCNLNKIIGTCKYLIFNIGVNTNNLANLFEFDIKLIDDFVTNPNAIQNQNILPNYAYQLSDQDIDIILDKNNFTKRNGLNAVYSTIKRAIVVIDLSKIISKNNTDLLCKFNNIFDVTYDISIYGSNSDAYKDLFEVSTNKKLVHKGSYTLLMANGNFTYQLPSFSCDLVKLSDSNNLVYYSKNSSSLNNIPNSGNYGRFTSNIPIDVDVTNANQIYFKGAGTNVYISVNYYTYE